MKILAISWASHTAVNRQIFRVLASEYGVEIMLVIPKSIVIGEVSFTCDSYSDENIGVISLEITSQNPRYNRYIGMSEVLQEFNPDVIYHEDDPISIQTIQYGIWSKFKGKKLICRTNQNTTIKYLDEIRRLGLLKGILYTSMKRSIFLITKRLVHHIFAISSDGVNIYKRLGFKNVTKIPLGFDEKIFNINPQVRKKIRDKMDVKGVVFAYIGRVIEGKGLHILLEALLKIKQYKWTLLIDSFEIKPKNGYHSKIQPLLNRLELEDKLRFFEADHEEIANYMNAADVVVVPSITTTSFKEQYGRVAPESMACGCLVIASNAGTLPELVSDYGWLFQQGNAAELSELLIKVIKSEDISSAGEFASEYAHQELGVDAQAKAMMAFF